MRFVLGVMATMDDLCQVALLTLGVNQNLLVLCLKL